MLHNVCNSKEAKKMSDCKHAGDKNAAGMIWCAKKNIYVSGTEKDHCADYEK